MLLDMLVWVSPEADLKIRNQVKVVYLGVEGQPEGMQGSETKGKEPQRVCDRSSRRRLWATRAQPTGEALGTSLKHTHP